MLTDFRKCVLLFAVRMFNSSEAVEFIQLDVLTPDLRDDRLVGGLSLDIGAIDPPLDGCGMNAFDARDSFWSEAFKSLLESALHLLLRCLEVIKGGAVTIAESLSTVSAADDTHGPAAADRIATVIS